MSDIETAEEFLKRGEGLGRVKLLEAITARDAAVAREARMALMAEFEANLTPYFVHARGVADTVLAELRAKYEKEPDGEA